MTNKELYRKYCAANAVVPVFSNPAWLDAVADEWNVVLYTDEHKKIIAALPYCLKGNLLTKRIYLPDFSFYQSVLFFTDAAKKEKQKIGEALFRELPVTLKSYFKFLPEHTAINLTKLNYQQEDYATYIIQHEKEILLSNNHKRNVQKGIKLNYQVRESKNLNASFALLTATFIRQQIKPKITFEEFKRLNGVAKKLGLGRTMDCIDEHKNLLASAFISEDANSTYYLFGGYDIAFKNSGAMTFLLHHLIMHSLKQHLHFNFCGSSKKSIAAYFEGFGAKKTALFIWKKSIL